MTHPLEMNQFDITIKTYTHRYNKYKFYTAGRKCFGTRLRMLICSRWKYEDINSKTIFLAFFFLHFAARDMFTLCIESNYFIFDTLARFVLSISEAMRAFLWFPEIPVTYIADLVLY